MALDTTFFADENKMHKVAISFSMGGGLSFVGFVISAFVKEPAAMYMFLASTGTFFAAAIAVLCISHRVDVKLNPPKEPPASPCKIM